MNQGRLPNISFNHIKVKGTRPDDELYFPAWYRLPELKKGLTDQKAALEAMWQSSRGISKLRSLESMADSVSDLRKYIGLAKAPKVIDLVKIWLDEGVDKIVLLGAHRDVLFMLREGLREYKPLLLYKGTPAEKRRSHLKKFHNSNKHRVFISQIKAMDSNVSLTNVQHICVVESSWVPHETAQAIMRVHKAGQESDVEVDFMILDGSIDDDIQKALKAEISSLLRVEK